MILLKELRTYSKEELMNKLEVDKDDFQKIIKILDDKKILKYNYRGEIQFSYVGIVIVKGKTIFILPKYAECKNKENEIQVIKQVIKLLNEFTEREKLDKHNIDSFSLEQETLEDNLIPIICFLLDDYIENNIYINEIDSSELNGDGEINWDKTIDLVDPIVINRQWFYSDLITNRSIIDNDRYITRLHGAIINECMEFLRDTGLNLVLTYNVDEIENSLEDLDEVDRIDREIENEIMVQFNDRKKRVLQAIRAYIAKRSDTSDVNLLLYGTRNFKWVWEVICGYVFDNEFVKSGKKSKYKIYGIESPKWYIDNRNSTESDDSNEYEMQKNRLTPDILKVVVYDDIRCLLILDAKYYNLRIENEYLKGNPGIDDITKQYLYHTTLKTYIEKNNIKKVINAFVFPCELKTYVQGEVVLDFMKQFSDVNINLIKLNVDEVINMYCGYKKYNLQYLISMIDTWNKKID
ncbi:LlaJI family restriction endonuclease [Clostridium botulinum]|uniref:LlaJI family restriction endonuclease n=1 Tax=Clostridium botulinum TaxID=1491 RepID=UPI0022460CF9|nr:LlaJI family restriction endonuclease [Clostridium botulinum]UZP04709.1 LlaJI family restriction endonuclease [Clostridium botulinum]UZP08121.1 LlaJI family restriction endonuclease [Clostridium botulinum]UZP11448.1 LlaJI family restriction endonuclease [Clostridium botulinum]